MTDSPNLLPCPFCGCTTIKTFSDKPDDWHYCDWCQSTGPIEAPDADPPQGWNRRADLAQPVAVEVKPLVWEGDPFTGRFTAFSLVCSYSVAPSQTKGGEYRLSISGEDQFTYHESADAAKAAAEAHHRDLILSQISTRSVNEVRNDALREAARAVEMAPNGIHYRPEHDLAQECQREVCAERIRALNSQPAPAPVQDEVVQRPSQAALDVLAERQRQIEVEGWTAEHDAGNFDGAIARAAASYALASAGFSPLGKAVWPWSREWWKPSDPRRNLVKSGALALAAIEQLDRADLAAREGR